MSGNKFEDIAPDEKSGKVGKSKGEEPVGRKSRLSKGSKVGIWIFALVSLGALGFAVLTLFSGAKVEIQPRSEKIELDKEFTAFYSGTGAHGDITYEVMELSGKGKTEVEAKGTKEVNEKASGKIVIYNEYSTGSQKIIDNTRFRGPNGAIYRMGDAVRVPGRHMEGGEKVPGKIEVTVRASKPGSEYNLKQGAEFTIPGLKGTVLYDGFYAKASTPISGGESGVKPVVSDKDKQKAVQSLKKENKKKIKEKALSQVPDDYYLYEGAMKVSHTVTSKTKEGKNKAIIVVNTKLNAALFPLSELAKMVAEANVTNYEGGEVYLPDSSDMEMKLVDSQGYEPGERKPFDFSLRGDTKLLWKVNKNKLKDELAGSSKGLLGDVLSEYRGVQKAEATISPFWRREFPRDKKDIEIKVKK